MNIGIIVDSSCGLSKEAAEKKGWIFLPLIASINNQEYQDGIDISPENYYSKMDIEDEVRTSATPPGLIYQAYEEASKKFDQTIVYGLSQELSSQTHNLKNIAKNFKNIHVIDSKAVGKVIVRDIEEGLKEAKFDDKLAKIKNNANNIYALFLPKTLKWLVKGGRVSPAVAKMANLLKIVPIIALEEGRLEKFGKGRSFIKTAIKCIKKVKEVSPNGEFLIYRGAHFEEEEIIFEEAKKILGKVDIVWLPPIIGNHTGPELFSIIMRKK